MTDRSGAAFVLFPPAHYVRPVGGEPFSAPYQIVHAGDENPPGVLRVILPRLDFDRLLDAAFEQIRQYAKTDVAVSLRLLRALMDIVSTTDDTETRQMIIERGRRIVQGCAERLGEEEIAEIRARLQMLEDGNYA